MRIFAKGHKLAQIDRSHCPSIPCKPSVSASAAAGIAARSHKAHHHQYCRASGRTLESAWSHAETALAMPAELAQSQAKLAGRAAAVPGLPPYAISWTPAHIASCQPALASEKQQRDTHPAQKQSNPTLKTSLLLLLLLLPLLLPPVLRAHGLLQVHKLLQSLLAPWLSPLSSFPSYSFSPACLPACLPSLVTPSPPT